MCNSPHTSPRPIGDASSLPDLAQIQAAQQRIYRYLRPTPVHYAERSKVYLKLETLQNTGSYKVRGALNAMLVAAEIGDHRPIICASAGNHAQGVAWAAHRLGVKAITVMPYGTPQTKMAGVAYWVGQILQHGSHYDESYTFALEMSQRNGYRFLSAFDDPDVIAGQGTVGLELVDSAPDVVIVPIGGGGLASGIALGLGHRGVRIIGAQVEGVNAMSRVMQGDTRELPPVQTLADGINVRVPGYLTRIVCSNLLDSIITISESELRQAIIQLAVEEHILAEGAGAVAFAVAQRLVQAKHKCAIISGGNIDASVLAQLLASTETQHSGILPPSTASGAQSSSESLIPPTGKPSAQKPQKELLSDDAFF